MQVVLPENAASLLPENIHDLRYAVRVKGNSGFVFLNNFQDDTLMLDKKNIQLKLRTGNGNLLIPETGGFNLKSGENVIFPFNFNLNGIILNYATSQILMKGGTESPYYVFFTPEGTNGEFSFSAGTTAINLQGTTIDSSTQRTLVKCIQKISEFEILNNSKRVKVLVVDKNFALKSYIVTIKGKKSLIFSDAIVLQNDNGFELLNDSINQFEMDIYPKISFLPKVSFGTLGKLNSNNAFSSFHITLPGFVFEKKVTEISSKKLSITLPHKLPNGINDIYLNIKYTGDTGMSFYNNEMVADNFYNGLTWQIGLRKFISPLFKTDKMILYFRPMYKNATYLLDLEPYPQYIPSFGNSNTYLKVNNINFVPQYKTTIVF